MSATVINFDTMSQSDASVHAPDAGIELLTDIDAEERAESSASSYQEGWIISYVDILTLLLTLFVILFAITHFQSQPSPLPRSEAALTATETHSSPPAASDNSLATDIVMTLPEQNVDAHVQEQSTVDKDPVSPINIGEAVASTPDASSIDVVQDVTTTKVAILSIDEHSLQTDSHAVDDFAYLNPDATELYDDRIDVEKILPVLATIEVADSEPAEQHAISVDEVMSAERAQDMAATANKSDSALLNQIHNSGLGQLIEISEVDDQVNLVISDDVLFALGSADLKPEGMQLLKQLAVMLIETQLNISVEGHTDNVPINNAQFPSNWELSTARATMVTRLLIDNQIAADRIRAIGYAATRPRATNETAQGRERNRRVSIILHMPDAGGPESSKDGVAAAQLSAAL